MSRKHRIVEPASLPAWTPFERSTLPKMSLLDRLDYIEAAAKDFGASITSTRAMLEDIDRTETLWVNSRYQVNVRRPEPSPGWPEMIHLSIKRHDKMPVGPERYRDFMRIKDELVGERNEAAELYPARSRETDTSTQYHLWVLADPTIQFPFGFRDGRHVRELPGGVGSAGARQNPFEPHHPHD